jgi:hypothetical protein
MNLTLSQRNKSQIKHLIQLQQIQIFYSEKAYVSEFGAVHVLRSLSHGGCWVLGACVAVFRFSELHLLVRFCSA